MALRWRGIPDFLDAAVCADQECASNDSQERPAQELLHAPRSKGFDDLELRSAAEVKIELVLRLESGLGLDRVAADPQDDHALFVEALLGVAKLGRFGGSTRRVRFGIEENHNAPASVTGKRNLAPRVCRHTKLRSRIALL